EVGLASGHEKVPTPINGVGTLMRGSTLLQIEKNYLRLHHLVRKRQSQQPLSGLHFPRLALIGFVATLFLITDSISLLV
ncbi:hypothetical protein, partial [Lacticaseibacillus paracasei]|uniref:hypothetical protein n=1 Tax=Lacticaseibacillus paracasei TaxID=1597 RepID=UPI001CDC1A8F